MKTWFLVAVFPAILSFEACEKNIASNNLPATPHDSARIVDTASGLSNSNISPQPPLPQVTTNVSNACPALPIYGDSVVYIQPTSGQDATLTPVNNPGTGQYFSWPAGMVINRNTGAIDLTQSETGMRYVIGFVPAGTTDTCLSTLIIGGASYYDSVYTETNGSVKAVPYFDADPALGSNCGGQGDGSGCKFDVTGSAQSAGVFVNNSSGEIDLQKTLNGQGNKGGVFGSNPTDGQTATVTFYYQLKHGSNNALEHIDVQFMYYSSASSIPAGLMNSLTSKLNNALNGLLISNSTNPRPPLIIIVRTR